MRWGALTWADLWWEGPMSAYVAATGDGLRHEASIRSSCGPNTNALRRRTRSQVGREIGLQASRSWTLEGWDLTIEAFTRIFGTLCYCWWHVPTCVHGLSWALQARLVDHSTVLSIVGETEEFWQQRRGRLQASRVVWPRMWLLLQPWCGWKDEVWRFIVVWRSSTRHAAGDRFIWLLPD
jgi:hypothetical protein